MTEDKATSAAEIRVREARTRCPYCHDDLGTSLLWRCPRCDTPHHEACVRENKKCTVLGCEGRVYSSAPPPERSAFPVNERAVEARREAQQQRQRYERIDSRLLGALNTILGGFIVFAVIVLSRPIPRYGAPDQLFFTQFLPFLLAVPFLVSGLWDLFDPVPARSRSALVWRTIGWLLFKLTEILASD